MTKEELLESASRIRLDIVVLIIAYLLHLFSIFGDILGVEGGSWYSRSGSLLVIFAALLEARTFSIRQKLDHAAIKEASGWDAETQDYAMPKGRKVLDRVVLGTLIYGTLVWGYGDLLF